MLKRLPLCIFFFILWLAALIFFAPNFINIKDVREKLITRLSEETGSQVEADQIQWSWLPLPHVSLSQVRFTNNYFDMILPDTRIFPHWRLLFGQEVDIGKIVLNNPQILIHAIELPQNSGQPLTLPRVTVEIRNGRIDLADGLLPESILPGAGQLLSVNAEIKTGKEWANFKLVSRTSFSDKISIKGYLDPGLGYELNFAIKELLVSKLLEPMIDGRITPVDSEVNLTGHLQGQGSKTMKAFVDGTFPCFILDPDDSSNLLKCGVVSLEFTKNDTGIEVAVKNLELETPGLILSGRIARSDEIPDVKPAEWLIDLTGRDLDMTAIRQSVLTLLGDNHITQTVCNIVKGGSARKANYYFKGPTSDFNHLDRMSIFVDVASSTIDVPLTQLHLSNAKGPIKIVHGNLSGVGLSTDMGDNRGENCSLFLDITGKDAAFMLDLDLDINVADLPAVLDDLVKNEPFKKELHKFRDVKGQASGHLKLGQTLHEIEAEVEVKSMKGGGSYQRLAKPFEVQGGKLNIMPTSVTWQEVKGVMGPHKINISDGSVDWQKKAKLKVDRFEGSIDAAALFNELAKNSALPGDIKKALTKIEGPLELRSARLQGPAAKPEKWQYKFSVDARGLKWTSPLLATSVLLEKGHADLSDDKVVFKDCKIWVREQPLSIDGDINHVNLTNWQGQVSIDGTIRDQLADLVRKKQWVPEPYFPKIPCTLKKFTISWDSGTTSFAGQIQAGMGGDNQARAILDIKNSPNQLHIKELNFIHQQERGLLKLDYWNVFPESLTMNWQGFLNHRTTDALLENNIFQADKIEGDFSISLSDHPSTTFLKGWLKAKEAVWPWPGDFKEIKIKNLDLDGRDQKKVQIKTLDLEADGAPLAVNGLVTTEADGLNLDLRVTSPDITWHTIDRLSKNLDRHVAGKTSPNKNEENLDASPWKVRGNIDFNFERLSSQPESNSEAATHPRLPQEINIWQPARGNLELKSADLFTAHFNSSKLCGIDISGTYQSSAELGENILTLITNSQRPPRFEETLPCLGWNQSLIEGDMHIDANLRGRGDTWQEGKIDLYSFKGNIRKMALLSKIFSVINLTDLFVDQGLPDLPHEGLIYSKIDINSHIDNNQVIIDRGVIEGKGLNLFGKGTIDLKTQTTEATLLIAPLKTLDAIVTNVPIFGKVIGGENAAFITIPVGIKGPVKDPEVTVLPPQEVGKALLGLVTTTLKLPFAIFNPFIPKNKEKMP